MVPDILPEVHPVRLWYRFTTVMLLLKSVAKIRSAELLARKAVILAMWMKAMYMA